MYLGQGFMKISKFSKLLKNRSQKNYKNLNVREKDVNFRKNQKIEFSKKIV